MTCESHPVNSELEFVRAMHQRPANADQCVGPVLNMVLVSDRVLVIDDLFDSEGASEILWSGFHFDYGEGFEFRMCGGHWLDLICFMWVRAQQRSDTGWMLYAGDLLQDLCFVARWDVKEIVNMFAWQRSRLT